MYLSAITIGYAVPDENFDAIVHSVFQSALNLRLSSGELLTVTSDAVDLPQGIRVDTPKDFSFEIFSVGDQVTCRDKNLRLDSSIISLHNARRWTCDLSTPGVDPTTPAISVAWTRVWDVLIQRQRHSKAEIIAEDLIHSSETIQSSVSRKAGEAMRKLVATTQRYDLTNTSSINSLIGLGSGLTPSGDDLLVGYIAGLYCSVRSQEGRAQFVKNLGDTIIQHSEQTNDISRTYLYHAAQGQVSSLLANLAEAICRGENSERLIEIAEAVMQVGHTSGMDTITGLLVGLAVWDGDNLLPING